MVAIKNFQLWFLIRDNSRLQGNQFESETNLTVENCSNTDDILENLQETRMDRPFKNLIAWKNITILGSFHQNWDWQCI